jgi:hypothetical protein
LLFEVSNKKGSEIFRNVWLDSSETGVKEISSKAVNYEYQ